MESGRRGRAILPQHSITNPPSDNNHQTATTTAIQQLYQLHLHQSFNTCLQHMYHQSIMYRNAQDWKTSKKSQIQRATTGYLRYLLHSAKLGTGYLTKLVKIIGKYEEIEKKKTSQRFQRFKDTVFVCLVV